MKILLIHPPQAQPFLPQLALPTLAASLRTEGHQVVLRDLNLEAYEDFLNPPSMEAAGVSPFNAPGIDSAKAQLRCNADYFDPGTYFEAMARINQDLSIISASHYLTRWNLKNYTVPPYREHNSRDLLAASKDREKNLFVDYFEQKVPRLIDQDMKIVGISVSWQSQLIPAITLARVIKNLAPRVHICLGGSLIGHLAKLLRQNKALFEVVDSILPFEADRTICDLARHLKAGRLSRVPGLIYQGRTGPFTMNPPLPLPFQTCPFADFDGLPLDKYYSPRVLPAHCRLPGLLLVPLHVLYPPSFRQLFPPPEGPSGI